MSEKKPRLFYYEDAENCWCPIDEASVEHLVNTGMLEDGETFDVQFKRVDMTDEEFDAIPEG